MQTLSPLSPGHWLLPAWVKGCLGGVIWLFRVFYRNCPLQILATAPSCSFWLSLNITTVSVYAIIVQSIALCQFLLPAPLFFFPLLYFQPLCEKILRYIVRRKKDCRIWSWFTALLQNNLPPQSPQRLHLGMAKGDKAKRKLEPHKLVGRRKFRYI